MELSHVRHRIFVEGKRVSTAFIPVSDTYTDRCRIDFELGPKMEMSVILLRRLSSWRRLSHRVRITECAKPFCSGNKAMFL